MTTPSLRYTVEFLWATIGKAETVAKGAVVVPMRHWFGASR
jgi:hypothetical protein